MMFSDASAWFRGATAGFVLVANEPRKHGTHRHKRNTGEHYVAISPAATVIASLFPDLWGLPGWLVFFVALAILLALVAWLKPILFSRVPIWVICHSFYWLRVRGRENVPR